MKPVSGEKLPLQSISRSQIWRGVRSQEGQSRDSALISAALFAIEDQVDEFAAVWGMRWLVPRVVFKGVMC